MTAAANGSWNDLTPARHPEHDRLCELRRRWLQLFARVAAVDSNEVEPGQRALRSTGPTFFGLHDELTEGFGIASRRGPLPFAA